MTKRTEHLPPVLEAAHRYVAAAVLRGGLAIDATVGNGHDTLFLAQQVGREGTVIGFDVQRAALEAATARLEGAGVVARVQLVHAGHETMVDHLPEDAQGKVQAVTFNLGYLPGGSDTSIVTRSETTLAALAAATQVLAPGGVISIVLYRGHPGGEDEAEAVLRWAQALPQETWSALSYRFINQRDAPPALLAIERRSP